MTIIAIASNGKTEDSEVSAIAGRPPYYLIYKDKKLIKTIKNPFAIGGGGAGFAVAKMLKDEKVDLVIAGRFGPNIEGALKEKQIKKKSMHGLTVKQAIKKI